MTANVESHLDHILNAVLNCLPAMDLLEQQLALELYGLLAQGEPVARRILANRLGVSVAAVDEILDCWPGVFCDSQQRIVGFWGLALPAAYKGPHQFRFNGRTLSTWCAWDSLFLPQLLEGEAEIASCSPEGVKVSLLISPSRVERVQPAETCMSFLLPDRAGIQKDIVTTFCHFIHFLPSRQAGEAWAAKHPGVFVLSLQDAFSLALQKNEKQYGKTRGRGA